MAELTVDQASSRDFLTVEEAAGMLELARNTGYKLVANGELPSFKLAGKRLVHRTVVEAILLCARSGDPEPMKTVREQLVAKYPEVVGGLLEAKV